MSAEWSEIDAQLIARAWEDEGFRATLLRDPAAAAAQAGLTLPAGVALQVVEAGAGVAVEAPSVHVLVLPAAPEVDESGAFELSAEGLDAVAGGGRGERPARRSPPARGTPATAARTPAKSLGISILWG